MSQDTNQIGIIHFQTASQAKVKDLSFQIQFQLYSHKSVSHLKFMLHFINRENKTLLLYCLGKMMGMKHKNNIKETLKKTKVNSFKYSSFINIRTTWNWNGIIYSVNNNFGLIVHDSLVHG